MNYLRHNEILETLIKWKVISLIGLQEECLYPGNRTSFLKLIQRLEKRNLIKNFYQPGFLEKILYPSESTIKLIAPDKGVSINHDHLFHDAVCSNVVRHLLKFPTVHTAQLRHEFFDQKNFSHYLEIDPDAIVWGEKVNNPFIMGIEIELHQKSRSRIFEKFENYVRSPYFTTVLYVFDKKSVFKSYQLRLQEFHENFPALKPKSQKKIIFSLIEDAASSKMNVGNGVTFYQEEDFYLEDIFHE